MSQTTSAAPSPTISTVELTRIASQIRRDIVRQVHGVQSGHPGGSLGCADFFTALYFKILKHSPQPWDMDGKDQDLFFLSNGHVSPVFYGALARSGYFPVKELATFRRINSRLQGHPTTHEGLPGVRMASGSLGQGLSVAIGAALAKKMNGDDRLVYTLHGDGELQEGQIWEAAMFAAGKKVDNLISTVDYNGRQIDGDVDDVLPLGDLKAKWVAFGWDVLETNGNNMEALLKTMADAKDRTGKGKPVMVLMRTEMGQGVDFMMNSHAWHGIAPNDEQLKSALAQLEETLGDY
ncbi:MAG TPA: transketolase [Flavobacteriales bacterium]|jgi:transketolase|nr:transketolase [Flavobacteriales bacterium]MBK7112219.1 transketolase [Flavobacteriales bacterium]MBK7481775.1 transketolase [Flavobacteriales bacterium]MBK8532413.1 transketolase [Flavobacteriales bacterium]MBP9178165.1 transketolase [Flavobacteriales bacterium]